MDLETRKYHSIKEIISIDRASVLDNLESVLKLENENVNEISAENKEELDNRLKAYKENPNDLLNWEDVKQNW